MFTSSKTFVFFIAILLISMMSHAETIKSDDYFNCTPEEALQFEIIWNAKKESGLLISKPRHCEHCDSRSFALNKKIYVVQKNVVQQLSDKPQLPVKAFGMICTLEKKLISIYIHQAAGAQ